MDSHQAPRSRIPTVSFNLCISPACATSSSSTLLSLFSQWLTLSLSPCTVTSSLESSLDESKSSMTSPSVPPRVLQREKPLGGSVRRVRWSL
ncbi:hypothetical protein FGO68_gene15579 [Halteria grandinella]|uniref:Uncharacterized protein n=1 Tax=Halteria grandinella TaxID=5974 RepID=A0A8J8NBJ9_HALGN|nr:hypothetical protein FGO68_gene15579 [Halteria grandinella]